MKKWQEWTIAVVAILVIVGLIGGVYWYLTKEDATDDSALVSTQSQEEKDLAEVTADLNGIEDLDLSALDAIDRDLQAIDLSSL